MRDEDIETGLSFSRRMIEAVRTDSHETIGIVLREIEFLSERMSKEDRRMFAFLSASEAIRESIHLGKTACLNLFPQDFIEEIISKSISIIKEDAQNTDKTSLFDAIDKGDAQRVREITHRLESEFDNASFSERDNKSKDLSFMKDAFTHAAAKGKADCIRAFPNRFVRGGNAALHTAAKAGHAEVVRVFVEQGIQVYGNVREEFQKALSDAAWKGQTECVAELLKVTDPKHSNSDALRRAAFGGSLECVRLLIPVSDPRNDYSSPLREATKKRHTDIVMELIPVSDMDRLFEFLEKECELTPSRREDIEYLEVMNDRYRLLQKNNETAKLAKDRNSL